MENARMFGERGFRFQIVFFDWFFVVPWIGSDCRHSVKGFGVPAVNGFDKTGRKDGNFGN